MRWAGEAGVTGVLDLGSHNMEWFQELYDDFRQRTGFGSISDDHTARDVDFIVKLCALRPGDRVLDVCAGTGRHSIELERRGIRATGFELNPDYVHLALERAESKGVAPSITVGDVRTAEFGTGFHAAVLMWNSFGFFSDEEDLRLLVKIGRALRPEGRFVLEILNRDFLLRHFEPRAERVVEGIGVVEERQFDMSTSRIKTIIMRREKSGVVVRRTNWRMYSLHELAAMGTTAGLNLLCAYANLDEEPADLDTRLMRLLFVRDGS